MIVATKNKPSCQGIWCVFSPRWRRKSRHEQKDPKGTYKLKKKVGPYLREVVEVSSFNLGTYDPYHDDFYLPGQTCCWDWPSPDLFQALNLYMKAPCDVITCVLVQRWGKTNEDNLLAWWTVKRSGFCPGKVAEVERVLKNIQKIACSQV